jgi:ribonuclease HI
MIIHTDGSCYARDKRMGVGVALFEDDSLLPFREEAITISGLGSSNEAEYHGIIHALLIILKEYNDKQIQIIINTDSQLICNQITGEWLCNNRDLRILLNEVLRLYDKIDIPRVLFNWVPRTNERQKIVDRLSKQANLYFQEKHERVKSRSSESI